jgi:subfamily B ATP-binding cassette protein MsbA
VLIFLAILPLSHSMMRRSQQIGRKARQNAAAFTSALLETFAGIRLVKVTASETREESKLLSFSESCIDDTFKAGMTANAVGPTTEFSGTVALIAVVLAGRTLIPSAQHGFATVLITFLFILFRMLNQVSVLNNRRAEFAHWLPSAEALADYLEAEDKQPLTNGTVQYQNLQSGIEFKNVNFSYRDSAQSVLKGVSFYIPKGSSLAIVGGSGAGKTTLADLLCRFFDPTDGAIYLDGTDLREFELSSLRKNIGLVSQNVFLFNDTIGNNIRYAKPEATEHELLEAARKAHALDFIQQLPLGLDSPVGERGAALSAGECQRIAIARALISDPDILILDEATSSLDPLSERTVQIAIEELMESRSTLIIAHRLSTIRKAHQIAVVHDGMIAELGTHEDLLRLDGKYKSMCEVGAFIT